MAVREGIVFAQQAFSQPLLGHTSPAHTRAYIDAEDYRKKANGVIAGLDL